MTRKGTPGEKYLIRRAATLSLEELNLACKNKLCSCLLSSVDDDGSFVCYHGHKTKLISVIKQINSDDDKLATVKDKIRRLLKRKGYSLS